MKKASAAGFLAKYAEQELRTLVRRLCAFSGKQLQAVSHLLSSDHIKQIKIAMDIPPTNQASICYQHVSWSSNPATQHSISKPVLVFFCLS
jgi:intergrase/recombinase